MNYQDFLKKKKVSLLSNQQINESSTKYVAEDLQNLLKSFSNVYRHFSYSDAEMKEGQAHNEYGEAELMELRLTVQEMYYSARGRIKICNSAERKMISVAMQYIVSIFANLPKVFMEETKKEIIEFIDDNDLL